jgi:hypothetical protein
MGEYKSTAQIFPRQAPGMPDRVYPIWHSGLPGAYTDFLFHCYSRAAKTENEILCIFNIGESGLHDIEDCLRQHGMALATVTQADIESRARKERSLAAVAKFHEEHPEARSDFLSLLGTLRDCSWCIDEFLDQVESRRAGIDDLASRNL